MRFVAAISHSRFRLILTIPMLAQMCLMLIMATHGRPAMKSMFPDWILHMTAYFILCLLARLAGQGIWPRANAHLQASAAAAISIAFAAIDELLQCTVTVRSCEFSDFTADTVGAFAALVCITFFSRFFKENSQ